MLSDDDRKARRMKAIRRSLQDAPCGYEAQGAGSAVDDSDVEWLLSEVERLEKETSRLREIISPKVYVLTRFNELYGHFAPREAAENYARSIGLTDYLIEEVAPNADR